MKKLLYTKPRNLMKAARKPKKPKITDVFDMKKKDKSKKNNRRRKY